MPFQLRPYQLEALDALRDGIRRGVHAQVLCAPTGSGKCHPAGTQIMIADGRTCAVEAIQSGDQLMAPGGAARTVLSVSEGFGDIYEVVPRKGEPWRCNVDHMLTLVRTREKLAGTYPCQRLAGNIVDVSLREWIGWSRWRKHVHKLFRVGVDYPTETQPVEPWLLGVLLGDGDVTNGRVGVTSVDAEIVVELRELAARWGVGLRQSSDPERTPTYYFSRGRCGQHDRNPLRFALEDVEVAEHRAGDKYIPDVYLYADRSQRLELLAGLIDTDGSLSLAGYDYVSKSPRLAAGMARLCRSLGFAAYVALKVVDGADYWRVSISGDLSVVPVRVSRKRAPARRQRKDVLRTGFRVRRVGLDRYYGFTLDGDGRYLLGDFTVTHNTVISAEIMRAADERGSHAWFVADREALVFQTSRRLTEAGLEHGLLMGDYTRGRHHRLQVASVQTIEKRGWFGRDLDVLIVDECHDVRRFIADYIAQSKTPVVGLSATPFTSGLGKIYDRVVTARTTNQLLADGWLTPLRVYCPTPIDMTGAPKTSGGEWSDKTVESRAIPIVGDVVSEWVEKTNAEFGGPVTTLVFASSVAHVEELVRAFGEAGYRFEAITYRSGDDPEQRQAKIRAAEEGRICGLISVNALGKGLDIPTVRCIVSARPFSNSLAAWIQQLGRGMRIADGKQFCCLLDHSRNWLRFADEVEDFWEHGIDQLHSGTKKKAGRRKPREETEHVCRGCKVVLPAGASMCPICGLGRPRRKPNLAVEAGTLQAYQAHQRQHGAPADPWPDLCRLAVDRGIRSPELWARFRYRELTGRWPTWERPFEPSSGRADPYVARLVDAAYRRWRRDQRKAG